MGEKFKSQDEVRKLAAKLKERRESLGFTLKEIEKLQEINCGQLSRFEAGQFKTRSRNLQKLCDFLQIQDLPMMLVGGSLGSRIEQFAARSPRHRDVVERFLNVLEQLG